MPIYGWICVGLTVALVIAFVLLERSARRSRLELEARIFDEGTPMLCYIMMANDSLHQKASGGYSFAQVICSPEQDVEDLPARLAEIAKELRDYETPETPSEDERIIGSVLRSHVPYSRPLLIPMDYTDDLEAYTISVNVYWEKLPGNLLNQQFLMYQVLVGADGGSVMLSLKEQKKARKIRVDGYEDYDGGIPR